MIKAIIWDIGGVLFPHQPWVGSEKPPLEELLKIKQAVINIYDEDKMSLDYLRAELFKSDLNRDVLEAAFSALTVIDQQVFDLIKQFHGHYLQFALANEVHKWTEIRDHLFSISQYFEKMYISIHHGLKKPDPRFFQLLLDENHLQPEECIFIDDKEINIKAAANIGIHALLFKNASVLSDQLKTAL